MSGRKKWQFAFVQSLTLARIVLVAVFLVITVIAQKPLGARAFTLAFAAMILSALTDLLDGWFARRFGVVTRLGGYADPMVDKVFYLVTFPTLVYLAGIAGQERHAQLLLGLTIVFLIRDLWVSLLRSIGAIYGVSGAANWSGKLRTIISFPSVCLIYYFLQAPRDWWLQIHELVVYLLEVAALLINAISIWVYTGRYWPSLSKELNRQDESDREETDA